MRLLARQCLVGLAVLIGLTVLLGVAYPAVVWGVSRIGAHSAEGSQVTDGNGCTVGSTSLGIDPKTAPGQPDPYLHSRVIGSTGDPFAAGDPSASAASQQGPNSPRLTGWIIARRTAIAAREGVAPDAVPPDAVTGSASGLDPDISPAYAAIQVPRIARVTGMSAEHVRAILLRHTAGRQLGFLGQPAVDVLAVNLALGLTAPGCR